MNTSCTLPGGNGPANNTGVCRVTFGRSLPCLASVGATMRAWMATCTTLLSGLRVRSAVSVADIVSLLNLHCVSENDTDVAHYNVAERVCYQTAICYPTLS